jgi:hypothetical protein
MAWSSTKSLGKQTANIGVKPALLQDQTDRCGVALKRPVDLFGSPVAAVCWPRTV